MRVVIKDHYQNVAIWLAEYIADKINSFKPTNQHPFVLGLATGSSPIAIYQHWIKMYLSNKLSFEHVITFNMDEYDINEFIQLQSEEDLYTFSQNYIITDFFKNNINNIKFKNKAQYNNTLMFIENNFNYDEATKLINIIEKLYENK